MKTLIKVFLSASVLLFLGACSSGYDTGFNANNGNGSNGGGVPTNPVTGVTDGDACSDYTPISNAYDSQRRHVYLGEFRFDKGSGPQGVYRQFLGDFGQFCANNSSGEWKLDPATGQYYYVYGHYYGTSNCSDWDDIAKLWISFPKHDPKSAHLTVDATLSGYPDGPTGEGYDTKRMQLGNAQIDCSVEDKTVIYFEPLNGYQFKVNIYKGNKSSEFMRAEVFYKGGSLGKTDFFIITNN